jgi:hypothetical protein
MRGEGGGDMAAVDDNCSSVVNSLPLMRDSLFTKSVLVVSISSSLDDKSVLFLNNSDS